MKVLGLTLLFAATTVQAEVLSCTAAEDSIKMIPSLIFNTTTKSASVEYALASKPISGKLIGERALDVDNEQGAKKYNLYFKHPDTRIIYDESEKHHSVLNVPGLEQHAIMIDSVSKRYSMCGARIGCIVSKNIDVMGAAMKFAQARLSPPTFAQIASEAALETPQSYFDEVIAEYKERRDVLVAELNKIKGVKVGNPNGAFYCIASLPIDNADTFAQWMLESYDLNGETVMVAPAAGFYSTPGIGLNEVRIAYVLKKEDLIRSVEILKDAISVYNAR